MTSKPLYIFDTNTLISAVLFKHSTPGRALFHALKEGFVLFSPDTLDELANVLKRERFDRYVTVTEREEFLEALVERSVVLEIEEKIQACRDPRDDKFLELAVGAQAKIIVSGDDDLLKLNPFRGIAILTPAEFLATTAATDI
jgi:putative PIN family toxin of toxin-antitoxin system